ncbi:inositol monophosphatase family protein [Actinospica robiniae]|uniref:inositol monophosphatase family protein n=1 Tax=Actinospica robiniae TaxID=304901 RepID=UPI001B7FDEAA|nr:inositol monophosphatase family protein [Actinospica robiniae]
MANAVARIVRTVMAESRPALLAAALTGQRGESENLRHEDNFLSEHDLRMHNRYRELFADALGSFVYASEEDDPRVIGADPDPDLVVLVDPLDTSELAVRALHGYTHVMLYSRSLRRPVTAVVGDIYHHLQLFIGCRHDDGRDRAYLVTADDDVHHLSTRAPVGISQALITNYLMRPAERLQPVARQQALIDALTTPSQDGAARGRIGVDFGSISLCHVASGQSDATIEFAKGFAIWDLSPGHYILHAAGGTVIDLQGKELPLDYGLDSLHDIAAAMNKRRKFIAAGGTSLAHEILDRLDT